MSDEHALLCAIEDALNQHGGDLGGWTKLNEQSCQIFAGRVTLKAEISPNEGGMEGLVHAHVFATMHDHQDEVLDACLMGMGEDRATGIKECALIWLTNVAGPIRSFLDAKPVCMTCQAGVTNGDPTQGYVAGTYGLDGLRAYVGPAMARGIDSDGYSMLDDAKPWFRFAAESAAPRRVHLAKVTVSACGENGWDRQLEIDGHEVSHSDPNWLPGARAPEFGYVTRFAVFEFPLNSTEIKRRAELDRTIKHFITNFCNFEDIEQLDAEMIEEGFSPELVHEVRNISTIAFGRLFFEPHGVNYSPVAIFARKNGNVDEGVQLASIPAFTRGKAILSKMADSLSEDEWNSLCFFAAESNALLQVLEQGGKNVDLSSIELLPCVIPEHGVPDETMDRALARLQAAADAGAKQVQAAQKPWWKFW